MMIKKRNFLKFIFCFRVDDDMILVLFVFKVFRERFFSDFSNYLILGFTYV